MATHSGTLAWKIPWIEESSGLYSPWGCEESDATDRLHFHFFFHLVISIEVSPVSLHGLIAHVFLVLNNILSSGCTTVPFTY